MLDVDIAALHRWGGLLRSSCVPVSSVPPPVAGGSTGAALAVWTAQMRAAVEQLNADLDRYAAAIGACAHNYEEVA